MATTYDFFISYPHKEREWVRRFVEALEQHNLKIWYDEKIIPPGEPFVEKLREGLRNSNAMIYIVTLEALNSRWALMELGGALGLKKKIIPLVAEDVPIGELVPPIRRRRWLIKGDPVVNANEVARAFSENGNGATPAVSELAAAS